MTISGTNLKRLNTA